MVFEKMDDDKLSKICNTFFNEEYHGSIKENDKDSWIGICYGINQHLLFCFPIYSTNSLSSIWCVFVLDINSQYNYISEKTIDALNISKHDSISSFRLIINNIETNVYASRFV